MIPTDIQSMLQSMLQSIYQHILPVAVILIVFILLSSAVIKQGHVGVVTRFGKYRRLMLPGLNFKIPLIDRVFKSISTQNQSIELEFEAISLDQAYVNFKSLIVYAAQDGEEETIKKIAFRFIDAGDILKRHLFLLR